MSDSAGPDRRPPLRVAAAILRDAGGRILLSQRPHSGELGGLWEFPGGKLEPGESAEHALRRELHEELGIDAGVARRFQRVCWAYPHRTVELDVFAVDEFSGLLHGREGQALRWAAARELLDLPLPAADRPIAVALNLPPICLVTPEPATGCGDFLRRLEGALDAGVRMVQLRARDLPADALRALATSVRRLTARYGAVAILNGDTDLACELGFDGVHLSASAAAAQYSRKQPARLLVGASCHDAIECANALAAGADFVFLAPVAATSSHPHGPPLGWGGFGALARATPLPSYALGGMVPADLAQAREHGGFGVAAIGALWPA